MTEDQELLAKIGQLAGQINQHKNRSSQDHRPTPSHHSSRPHRGGWAPYHVRGAQRRPVTHRNRTLVLNSNSPAPAGDKGNLTSDTGDYDSESKQGSSNGWVAKRDRHMQLINSAIYDKEAQARTKAISETQKLKVARRAKAEEAKVMRYVHGNARQAPAVFPTQATAQRQTPYQILVNDVPFQVARGGSKLIKISNDPTTANTTPKRVTVGGVTFVRSKKGNLHRLGAVASKRKPAQVKKRNELCKRFSRTGTCYKGPACPFIHDPDKVAICKDFLQTGQCPAGDSCDLSHEPSPHRCPVCVHFLRGRCSNPNCRYTHVRVTPGAPVCRDFAVLGYCEKGAACEERHVYECPDYANTGSCKKKKCTLPHVDRAGQIRKNTANRAGSPTPDGEDEDVSSDEEEYDAIDSDDVDSDELDDPEEVIEGGAEDSELSGQQDFVHF